MRLQSSSPTDPAELTVLDAIHALRAGEVTAIDLLKTSLERITASNGGAPSFDGQSSSINAWARIYQERALEQAKKADQRLRREEQDAPLLCGVPWGVKDLFPVESLPLTASSKVLEGHIAQSSASVVEHLEAQGMVLVGHTHTHEFAAGGSTDQVGNPWALDRSAGGSSGGSAAAVATGMVPTALGTDTAGSIRIPASLCGVSAFKPSFNKIPATGIIPLSSTLDHVGPIARTVADCAILINSMSEARATALPWMTWGDSPLSLPSSTAQGSRPLAGMRIAITDRSMIDLDQDVADAVQTARYACQKLGAEIVELPAPVAMEKKDYDTILLAEARSYHAQHSTKQTLYRDSTRDFLAFGSPEVPARQYLLSQQARISVTNQWHRWFLEHGIDAVLEPTQAITAPKRGDGYRSQRAVGGEDPMTQFTALWNFTGFPVVTLPVSMGKTSQLPMSVSLVSGPGQEHRATKIGLALQAHELPIFSPDIENHKGA